MNENKCNLYRVYLPDVCIMHKQIHSMTFFFSFNCIFREQGSGMINISAALISAMQNIAFEETNEREPFQGVDFANIC